MEDFWNDINREAIARRLKWGHIANYPARLIEQLIRDDALTVEERNELIQLELERKDVTQESAES
jgi:hypothetical protein